MSEPIRSEEDPVDRLTAFCDLMFEVLEEMGDDAEDVRAIVLLSEGNQAAASLYGYEKDEEDIAVKHMLSHARALLRSQGRDLAIIEQGRPEDQ